MVKLESLTQGEMYRKHHMNPSDADNDDDDKPIVQLETSEGDYIYTSCPTCPFDPDDVSRINNGVLKGTMTYMTIREGRVTDIIYISIYRKTGIFTSSIVRLIFKRKKCTFVEIIYAFVYLYIEGVTGGTDQISGGFSLC